MEMGNKERTTIRNSNYELLRIMAMGMIILFHIVRWYFYTASGGNLNKDFYALFDGTKSFYFIAVARQLFGWGGNALFAMISGYFLVGRTQSWARIGKLAVGVYGMLLFALIVTMGIHVISWQLGWQPEGTPFDVRNAFDMNSFWYLQNYIVLLMLLPFFSGRLNSISRGTYLSIIVLSYLVFEVIDLPEKIFLIDPKFQFIWMGFIIGGFFKRFPVFSKTKISVLIIGMIVPIITYVGMVFVDVEVLGKERDFHDTSYLYLIFAVSIFAIFTKLEIHSRLINQIAKTMPFVFVIQIMAYRMIVFLTTDIMGTSYGLGFKMIMLSGLSLALLALGIVVGILYDPIARVIKNTFFKIVTPDLNFSEQ
jgi:hypothetical protein